MLHCKRTVQRHVAGTVVVAPAHECTPGRSGCGAIRWINMLCKHTRRWNADCQNAGATVGLGNIALHHLKLRSSNAAHHLSSRASGSDWNASSNTSVALPQLAVPDSTFSSTQNTSGCRGREGQGGARATHELQACSCQAGRSWMLQACATSAPVNRDCPAPNPNRTAMLSPSHMQAFKAEGEHLPCGCCHAHARPMPGL